jgi:hypothetical protein
MASLRRRVRMPVKARCAPFNERSLPTLSAAGGWVSASISSCALSYRFPAFADAAIDDLLQLIGAAEVAGPRRCDPVFRGAFTSIPRSCPT